MLKVTILLCYLGIAKCGERIPFPATTTQKESKIKLLNRVSLKEGEELKELLNHWPGLAFLCTMKPVKCPDEEAVSIRLPKIFSNIEFYPECTKNCSWRIKCGFRIQFMHISEALSLRIPNIYYSCKSASRIMRAAIREESRLTTSGSIVTEIPGKTGRSSCTIRVTFRSC